VAGLASASLAAASCTTDSPPPGCQIVEATAEDGTPLTLLPDARLDRIGGGFVLSGFDGQAVRWAPVDGGGRVGIEQSATVPGPIDAGPWFAVAGAGSAGDAVVIAYGVAAGGGQDLDVMTQAVPADGAPPAAAPGRLLTIPGFAGGAAIALGSSRLGMRAALAWVTPGSAVVQVQLIGGDGRPYGQPVSQPLADDDTVPAVSCLSFGPGRDELTVSYLTQVAAGDPSPKLTVVELRESASFDGAVRLELGTSGPTCPLSAPTDAHGYVVAWQNEIGGWLGVFDAMANKSSLFAGAVAFGGPALQPPLVGLGPAGADYALILAQPGAAEAWRLDADGQRTEAPLIFPSLERRLGQISAVPAPGSLYATYADYQTAGGGGPGAASGGQRYFLKIGCL
jgi:hypothetical protein